MKSVNRKRGGSAFPKQRDKAFCRWVATENPCIGTGLVFPRRISLHDAGDYLLGRFVHYCWGENTPAHVGKHRATGAPDRGRVVCMCKALHTYYDRRRSECNQVLSEEILQRGALRLQALYESEHPTP